MLIDLASFGAALVAFVLGAAVLYVFFTLLFAWRGFRRWLSGVG